MTTETERLKEQFAKNKAERKIRVHDLCFETDALYRDTQKHKNTQEEKNTIFEIVQEVTKGKYEIVLASDCIRVKAVDIDNNTDDLIMNLVASQVHNLVGCGDYFLSYRAGSYYFKGGS